MGFVFFALFCFFLIEVWIGFRFFMFLKFFRSRLKAFHKMSHTPMTAMGSVWYAKSQELDNFLRQFLYQLVCEKRLESSIVSFIHCLVTSELPAPAIEIGSRTLYDNKALCSSKLCKKSWKDEPVSLSFSAINPRLT